MADDLAQAREVLRLYRRQVTIDGQPIDVDALLPELLGNFYHVLGIFTIAEGYRFAANAALDILEGKTP